MRDLIYLIESKSSREKLEPVALSYTGSGLVPVLSSGNLRQHQKLWQGYCDKFNNGVGDRQYNYAGYLLHNLFFTQFRQPRTVNPPNGPIGGFIKSKFKNYDAFKDKFLDAVESFTGSGWIYLARDGSIKTIQNHAVRGDIILLLDMWEHSYMQDYGSNREKYLNGFWRIIDWNAVNTRYMAPYRT